MSGRIESRIEPRSSGGPTVASVDRHDHVALADAGAGGGTVVGGGADVGALVDLEVLLDREVRGDGLRSTPRGRPSAPAAICCALAIVSFAESIAIANPMFSACVVAGGVDADHAALHVDERAAGVAVVDRGVGLDHVAVGAHGHGGSPFVGHVSQSGSCAWIVRSSDDTMPVVTVGPPSSARA